MTGDISDCPNSGRAAGLGGQRPRTLVNTLQCTEWPTTKSDLAPRVSGQGCDTQAPVSSSEPGLRIGTIWEPERPPDQLYQRVGAGAGFHAAGAPHPWRVQPRGGLLV